MNYDEILKAIMLGEKIYNLPLRVCYYCRVSTDSDVQLNSLDNQLEYYENYIKSKPKWIFSGGYIEEGKTGVRVDVRPSFKKMIQDAKHKKFDLIITKEVSRFARDLEDSIHYIRELKDSGVGVFFENQNLNTFDYNSELILNIMFNLAQDESRKLSSRVKFGHRQAIENGHVLGSSNITGYRKDNCKLVIVENEAKFIKTLFELYATGKYGFLKLSKKLSELGYLNKKGKLYDKDSLKRMIENPKYKGYYRARTYEILDYRTKRRKKNNLDEQILYKCKDGSIPAIISEELWDQANRILKSRTKGYENNNYWSGGLKYAFSSKIYCKEHNTSFQRSHGNKNKSRPIWSCGMYLQHRLAACESPIIAEVDLYNIMSSIMNSIIPQKINIIENMLKLYENIDKNDYYDKELKLLNTKIKIIEEKKSMTLELVFNGDISKESVKVQFDKYEQEIKSLNEKKTIIIKQVKQLNNSNNNLNVMAELIEKELNGGSLSEFIRKFVDEIIISKIDGDRYNIKLDIYLDLLGEEKLKIKGARHINGPTTDYILYKKNQTCNTVESKKSLDNANIFTYDVYVKTF
ncbi:MAG: recombinase family protein [Mollicutes bacterium]|nr:recombinase family protein [Mollicutes bacterium]